MNERFVAARYLGGYTVWLRLGDGTEGTVDLSAELTGPMFDPLRDVALFAQVALHPELRTLVWPNGADFAPELLVMGLNQISWSPLPGLTGWQPPERSMRRTAAVQPAMPADYRDSVMRS